MAEPFDRIVQFTYFIYLHCIKYPSSIEQSVHAQGMNRDKCEIRSSISNAIQNSIVAELIFGISDVRSIDLQNRLMIDVKRNLTMANVFTNAKENNVLRFLPSSYDVLVLHNSIQFLWCAHVHVQERVWKNFQSGLMWNLRHCKSYGTNHKIFKTENKSALNLSNWAQNARNEESKKYKDYIIIEFLLTLLSFFHSTGVELCCIGHSAIEPICRKHD